LTVQYHLKRNKLLNKCSLQAALQQASLKVTGHHLSNSVSANRALLWCGQLWCYP